MKKTLLVLAILIAATPAFGVGVSITAEADGNEVTVKYQVTGGDPNLIRAFALNISADNDANITMLDAYDPNYWVYPGSIVIVDGNVTQPGSPVADPCAYPGSNTLPGDGTGGLTIEMGSLYASGDGNQPDVNGVLCVFTVDANCCITIKENAPRGGIVMEKQGVSVSSNLPAEKIVCVGAGPDVNDTCWNPALCVIQNQGDATCDGNTNLADLFALKSAYGTSRGDPNYNCCADFTQDWTINLSDLFALKAGYGQTLQQPSTLNQNCPP